MHEGVNDMHHLKQQVDWRKMFGNTSLIVARDGPAYRHGELRGVNWVSGSQAVKEPGAWKALSTMLTAPA